MKYLTLTTTAEATVTERWTLAMSDEVASAIKAEAETGIGYQSEILDRDDVEIVSVVDAKVDGEHDREVLGVEWNVQP